MQYQALIEQLWQQYSSDIRVARDIYRLFQEEGEVVVNDHIALRTFDDARVNVDVLAQPFKACGYVEKGVYDFPNKKLFAKHYEHAIDHQAPKIFISQLLTEYFSDALQSCVRSLIDAIPESTVCNPQKLMLCGRPWGEIHYSLYEKLLRESQYAAWMYAFGYRVNHFTISVNHLKKYNTIEKVNDFLKKQGYALNAEGGEIKGTKEEFLEQSSIMAERKKIAFSEGEFEIPSCYYEFALRYKDTSGKLYQGFVAASADKIFESTHNNKMK